MNIAIRVDANKDIGTGHLMRCIAIASELSSRGAYIKFICNKLPQKLDDRVRDSGFDLYVLPEKKESGFEKINQEEDAKNTLLAISDRQWEWVIVDNYSLDAQWENQLRSLGAKIFVIDDLADRTHSCDFLLDQNMFHDMESRYENLVPKHCKKLLGPKYALLRKEFVEARKDAHIRDGVVRRIFVFFGGMDNENYTSIALKSLSKSVSPEIIIDIVIGAVHPFKDAIQSDCRSLGYNLHIQIDHMSDLLVKADLSIGAGGVVTWERCCLGLPAFVVAIADNQREHTSYLASTGIVYSPSPDRDLEKFMSRHIQTLLENQELLKAMSMNSLKLVDGKGVSRVARYMGVFAISIRRANIADMENVFHWRNEPSIRSMSMNSGEIEWERHVAWYEKTVNDDNRLLLIGEKNNTAVGVVRFDLLDNKANVSIYVVPEYGFEGLGGELLSAAESWLRKSRPDIDCITADVLGSNDKSKYLFEAYGYKQVSVSYEKRFYEGSIN